VLQPALLVMVTAISTVVLDGAFAATETGISRSA
jgi:hypothetical protein